MCTVSVVAVLLVFVCHAPEVGVAHWCHADWSSHSARYNIGSCRATVDVFFTERNTLSNGLWKFERGTIVFAGISKNFENRDESLCT